MAIRIDSITLRHIRMPLVHFFETSFGRTSERDIILVQAESGGLTGWGEVTAGENPFYNEEWTASVWPILIDYIVPRILHIAFASPEEVAPRTAHLRGHLMARGGLEAALWDLAARQRNEPLWQTIGGGAHRQIACGVSIGIQDSVEQLLEKIHTELAAGYRRIKLKIKPGWDVHVLRQVRDAFPETPLMADANSAYTLADAAHLRTLDNFNLMMVEQPLAHDDLIDHAALQATMRTPICLDESIRSARHAEQALRIDAGRIINIKLGRVGGFAEARRIHNLCQQRGIPVWCGGMLESGIGRAHNVALSTLPNFVLPGDVSASKRYWQRDIVTPPIEVSTAGTIAVSPEPGFGYEIDHAYLDRLTVRKQTLR